MTPTDEQMRLAREIVNDNSNYMRGLDRGQRNFSAEEALNIALAAIQATTEAHVAWLRGKGAFADRMAKETISPGQRNIALTGRDTLNEAAAAIERGDHLKGHPHG